MHRLSAFRVRGGHSRSGAVSVMFAGMAIPLVLAAGLATDYSFYVQAQAQLITAADAASLHAVRVAAADFIAGQTVAQSQAAGTAAGTQWFAAQIGNITDANVPSGNVSVPLVNYTNGTFTETVSYQGTVNTHLAAHLTGTPAWPIQGSSTASISADNYAGFYFLIDNSSSMLIGASPADIIKMEALTLCAPTATATQMGKDMGNYAWTYPAPYSYSETTNGKSPPTWTTGKVPLPVAQGGPPSGSSCPSTFSGGTAQCPYPPSMTAYGSNTPIVNAAGYCPAGTGVPDPGYPNTNNGNAIAVRIDPITHVKANIPQAPCGFACHAGDGVHDFYTLVRQSKLNITLRFDVIQQAAANVMNLLITRQQDTQIANQFTVGVYQFNSGVTQVHPQAGGPIAEADSDLTGAQTDIKNITTPIVTVDENTNFTGAIASLAATLKPAGSGGSASTRTKNLFIITDGLEDDDDSGRHIGNMTEGPPATETNCSQLKALGYSIYVLYTPYYPLPNPFYLNQGPRGFVEPTVPPATTNPAIAALQACASSPKQFYQVSTNNVTDIDAALQNAVQAALASPGTITR